MELGVSHGVNACRPWKGGFLGHATEHQIALVFPDTSPRGTGIAGEDDSWDLGTGAPPHPPTAHTLYFTNLGTHTGAGFYLDATNPTWSKHYNMYTYITSELPSLLRSLKVLPLDLSRQSIFGHSMGGHGAVSLYLRTIVAGAYKSVSAFAPALNPTNAPMAVKAFNEYLQGGLKEGEKWDSTCLIWEVPEGTRLNVLIDVVSAVCLRGVVIEVDARAGRGRPVL